jgi:hypothetical protein
VLIVSDCVLRISWKKVSLHWQQVSAVDMDLMLSVVAWRHDWLARGRNGDDIKLSAVCGSVVHAPASLSVVKYPKYCTAAQVDYKLVCRRLRITMFHELENDGNKQNCGFRSLGMWHGLGWLTDVSGHSICPIFNDQAVKEENCVHYVNNVDGEGKDSITFNTECCFSAHKWYKYKYALF